MKKHILLVTSLFCLIASCLAQPLPTARKRAVYGKGYYIAPSRYDYSEVAKEVTKDTSSAYEQAKALYLWICENISYDTQTDIRTADLCWDKRRAVCQGYCELFYRMAETLGLKTQLVYGRSRNSLDSHENHSWLSVRTEKGDILLDPTWGAGSVIFGEFKRNSTPLVWFDPAPELFIHTHFPENKKHQHLKNTVKPEAFDTLKYVRPHHELGT